MFKKRLDKIRPLLRSDMPFVENNRYFNFLSPDIKNQFNIHNTKEISNHQYGNDVLPMIEEISKQNGIIIDIGAGSKKKLHDNVFNLEIVPYASTDILCVGEILPFVDNSIDGIISIAVLEHVKDPFRCADEMIRVLKPGGKLYCVVPFLQPMHAYPNHYYNMTKQGLQNLFDDHLIIDNIECFKNLYPIWVLSWFLNSWANGLDNPIRHRFLDMKVRDLMRDPKTYLNMDFVKNLSSEKNSELASAHALTAHKPL